MINLFKYLSSKSKNSKDVKTRYAYWRVRILYSMYIGYVVYYFNRSSFKLLDTFLINEGILTKEFYGITLAMSGVAYAFSKFLGGILADLTHPRFLMFLGLFSSGVINIAMANIDSPYILSALWILNGLFQGFGWPPVAYMLTRWFSKDIRGSWWGLWSTSHNLGEFLMPVILTFIFSRWRLGLYIPGIAAILISLFLLDRLRDDPSDVNLPPADRVTKKGKRDRLISFWRVLVENIFNNVQIWFLIVSSVGIYFIRGAITPWISHFFLSFGYSYVESISLISAFEFGGFFGTISSGFISDLFFNGKRSLVNLIYSLGIVVSIFLIYLNTGSPSIEYFSVAMLGFSVYGPQMLLGVTIAELTDEKSISTATGFAGLWSYLGMSFAHVLVPRLSADRYFLYLLLSGIVTVIFFIPSIRVEYFNSKISSRKS